MSLCECPSRAGLQISLEPARYVALASEDVHEAFDLIHGTASRTNQADGRETDLGLKLGTSHR